jgi:hypothetical protein
MKVNITYPQVLKKHRSRRRLLDILKWPFILAGIACIIVNICVGGKLWSVIAVVGLRMIWKLCFDLDLVEYNRISQFIKASIYACIIIALIHFLITPIWALGIISSLGYGSLVISGILFLTDIKRQKQNMLPMFSFIVIAIIGSAIGFMFSNESDLWTVIVLCSISVVLLFVCIFVLRLDFIRNIKKRFHIR